jgi:hypothetical protein
MPELAADATDGTSTVAQLQFLVAQLQANLTKVTQERDVLLEFAGGTTPTTTQPAPTTIVNGVHVKASTYDYIVLAGASVIMLILWILPLTKPIRGVIEARIYRIYPIITVINFFILAITLSVLDFVEFNDLFFDVVKVIEVVISSTQQVLVACVGFIVVIFLWKFKDRILEAIGVDNPQMVIGEFRDWATCWSMKRFSPIELFIWKVEGLPGIHLHQFNDVFIEVACGYNNVMRTRVHEKAGHTCLFKESMQLNFDKVDSENMFHIEVKNQDVMGASDIASLTMGASKVRELLEPKGEGLAATNRTVGWNSEAGVKSAWADSRFLHFDLIPAGTIWLRFEPVDEETQVYPKWV